MYMRVRQNHSGFTIVELLIVIVVIGILAALAYGAFAGVQQKARLRAAQTEMLAFGKQVALYQAETETYPTTAGQFSDILKSAGLYDITRTQTKSFAICASPSGYTFTAWNPVITDYKNGDFLYLYGTGQGQGVYELKNSSLSSTPNRLDKICDQLYPGASFESWTYDIP